MSYLQQQIGQLIKLAEEQEHIEPQYEITQWVATNSTQYIDTGFIADQNSKIEIGFNILDTGTAVKAVFGSRKWDGSSVSQAFYFYKINGTTVQIGWGSQSKNIALDSATEIQAPMRLIIDKGSVTLITSAKTYTETFTSETFETATSLIIGTSRTGTTGTELDNRPASVDVRYCKLWNNGTPAYNYYPSLDSKMQPCLYDKVTKTFAYAKKISDGTTTYDLGFKRWNKFDVDYIENTGTAYIPFADITPTTTMGMNIEYAYTVLSSSEPAGVIGTYNGDTQRKDTFFVSTSSGYTQKASSPSSASCGVMVFHRGGNVGTSSSTSATYIEPEKDVWYTATVNWLGNGEITWTDGTNELSANVGSNTVVTNQLRLFSRCNSSNSTYNNCKSRVRKLQFSDGDKIIRSFKPVVWHNSDTTAIATLYDEVYNKMCTPNGSLKAYIVGADDIVYEVGKSVSGTPSSSVSGVSNCFDTGLYGTQDTTVKHIAIAYDDNSTSGQLFGSYDGTTATSKNLTINSTGSSGNTAPIRFDGKVITTPIRIALNKSVSIVNSKYGLWVNDTLHGSWGDVNDFTTLTTMLILKCNNSTNVRNNGCGYCMILEKDVPVVEYIPVKNGSTIGLYDKVSKTLNTGEGTINFNSLD